jgi:hypothetical protein
VKKRGSDAKLGFLGKPGFASGGGGGGGGGGEATLAGKSGKTKHRTNICERGIGRFQGI